MDKQSFSTNKIPVKNIFAAVFEKPDLDPILSVLSKGKVNFWGTEGTVKYLKSKGFAVTSVVFGFDFDGRVKSLDRDNFVRVLADRTNLKHLKELKQLKVEPYDLVIVDLYALDPKIFPESMDIGGMSLIRAAIKNYKNVALAFDRMSIFDLASELRRNESATTLDFRKKQAKAALKFVAERCALEAALAGKI